MTQQLAKNLFLTQERTLDAQDAGSRCWRCGWSASIHQERDPRALSQPRLFRLRRLWRGGRGAALFRQVRAATSTLAEAAMLAGLVKSPSRLAPNRNPERRREARARSCSTAMARRGLHQRQAQAQASIGQPAHAREAAGAGIDQLCRRLDHGRARRPDRPASTRDIVVETTIDPTLQSVAEAAHGRRARGQGREVRRRARARWWR